MKNLIALFVCLITYATCKAQRQKSDEVYWTTLHEYTLALDKLYKPAQKVIYLEKPEYLDSIPPQINGYQIILITPAKQRKLYKKNKGKLIHTKMFPIAIKDSLLQITITPYFGTLKGNHYNLGVSHGFTTYFRYNYNQKRFVVSRVESWGI